MRIARSAVIGLALAVGPICWLAGAEVAPAGASSPMTVHVLRLRPGDDLKRSLRSYAEASGLRAGVLLTCSGSLTRAVIRFADRSQGRVLEGRFEIVSLTGTLSPDGDHLHVSVSDGDGRTLGGHLLDGSLVYTTAEIAIGELRELEFRRESDPRSGYKELVVAPRSEGPARD